MPILLLQKKQANVLQENPNFGKWSTHIDFQIFCHNILKEKF